MVDSDTSQKMSSQSNVAIPRPHKERVSRNASTGNIIQRVQQVPHTISIHDNKKTTVRLDKRNHSGDSSQMVVQEKGNYGLTEGSWPKPPLLYTTTGDYATQAVTNMSQ
jgi:hypothetical protein